MSTILVAVIIVALAVIPPYFLIQLGKRREKRHRNTLLAHLERVGAVHGLSLTHHEILKDKMLGLDVERQTLLFCAPGTAHTETLIDLTHTATCTVYKQYSRAGVRSENGATAVHGPTQLGLEMTFSNNASPELICFYDSGVNVVHETPELEKKAKEWERLITRTAQSQAKVPA